MAEIKKYHDKYSYFGSDMDNYAADMELWKNLSQSFTQEQRVAIVKKFRIVAMSNHRVSPRQRNAYLMKYEQGLSNLEIANVMGISVKTVKNHICKANKVIGPITKEIED